MKIVILSEENPSLSHYVADFGSLQVLNAPVVLIRDTSGCLKNAHVATDADGAVGFEGCQNVYPLHLGMDVLKKLRLYLATKEQKLYFTLANEHKSSK